MECFYVVFLEPCGYLFAVVGVAIRSNNGIVHDITRKGHVTQVIGRPGRRRRAGRGFWVVHYRNSSCVQQMTGACHIHQKCWQLQRSRAAAEARRPRKRRRQPDAAALPRQPRSHRLGQVENTTQKRFYRARAPSREPPHPPWQHVFHPS
jgi:hypothetical protein